MNDFNQRYGPWLLAFALIALALVVAIHIAIQLHDVIEVALHGIK